MHFSALSVVLASILMLPVFVLPTLPQLGLLLLIGLFGSAGQVTLTYSYKHAPASEVSIYSYAGIVWSVLLGWMFLQESVTWAFAIGSLLIVGASLAVFLGNNKIKTIQEAEFGKEA
jgi:drug/metabolite transporter (DMT)-like permease